MGKTVRVSVTLEDEQIALLDELRVRAQPGHELYDRSRSWLVRHAIEVAYGWYRNSDDDEELWGDPDTRLVR